MFTEQVLDLLREVGNLTGDASVGRGLVTSIGVTAATLTAGWRLLRRKKPERVKVIVDAPQGERVLVQLGDSEVREV